MSIPPAADPDAAVVLQRRLLRACRAAAGRLKMADSLGTRLTGRDLLIRILVARRVLDRVLAPDEKRVGVLLPPTAGAAIVNAALSLSGRVAVNLNYTSAQPILDVCMERAGLKHVISSPLFLARVKLAVGDRLLDAGELKQRATVLDKVQGFLQATVVPVPLLERALGLHRLRPEDPLTVIFTSGSTGDPKGVVLSEENVCSNVRAIDQLLHLSPADVALGVLPFFHSYGYTTTLWTPLVLDPAVVYHTDPRDAQVVGRLAREYHATILMATPTFLRIYVRRTPAEDFASLEAVFGAAEKLPKEVSNAFEEKFGVRPSEAYGATELSPLVAANVPPSRHVPGRPVDAREGTVGQPIAGSRAKITDREGERELPLGEEGLLWISGPNVMQGYLDRPDLTAGVVRDGWYCTGDIAKLDAEGFITITGRESRFSKIGGEMVPHLSVEEAVNEALGAADGELLAVVTAVPDRAKGERLVVFHLPTEREPRGVVASLRERGLPNLWIPSPECFCEIAEIPVLGTGKLDLRRLTELAGERFGGAEA
ncbi:MAG: AMP-binding protein [Planctomycetota bacterium]|jgi:acyl-[acyl-carrier-protein]-phospholipid O-acyltransferase/long-chain-fatty-acid--[acyl-carrier-protein] ligase|nr:AMP-binding protein [Planctomycetota bacterium]